MAKRKTRLFHTIVVVGATLATPLAKAEKPASEMKAPAKKRTKKKQKAPDSPLPPKMNRIEAPAPKQQIIEAHRTPIVPIESPPPSQEHHDVGKS